MRKINRGLLLFVAVVLLAGVCRGQEQTEDFAAFANRFLSDCEFQKSCVTFPLQSRHLDEDTFRVVVVEEKDWQCVPVSSFSIKIGECVESVEPGVRCIVFTVEDTGILVEYRFGKIEEKWFLVGVVNYSM